MKKLFITLSSIPLSLYRNSVAGLKMENPNLYSEIFSKYGSGTNNKNKNRIYLPLDSKAIVDTKNPNTKIVEFLTKNNFKIDNYKLGTAIMPDGKRTIKIGKILAKEPDLKKLFDNDPSRSGANHLADGMLVVVSRHPYDILGISFNRGWTSCTNLDGGSNADRLKSSLKYGLLVAYLIKASDENINKPIARILIRPYFNSMSDAVLSADKIEYGAANAAFRKTTLTFLNWANSGSPKGKYKAPEKMYLDAAANEVWYGFTAKDVTKAVQIQYLTDETELMVLAKLQTSFRKAVMENPYATPKVLMLGAIDKETSVRAAVMRNPNASTEILRLGAKSKEPEVRAAVMRNPNASTEMLMIGAKDTDSMVRAEVMIHENVSPEILMLGAKDTDPIVRYSVMIRENVSPEILMLGAKDTDSMVRVAVMKNPNASLEILMIGAKDTDPTVRSEVAHNTKASAEILMLGAKDKNFDVLFAVVHNKNASTEMLMIVAKAKDYRLRAAVMRNNKASTEILMLGAKDTDPRVRATVMKNPNASAEILRLGAKDTDRRVRAEVMLREKATPEIESN